MRFNDWIAVEGAKNMDKHGDDDKPNGGKPTNPKQSTKKIAKNNDDDYHQRVRGHIFACLHQTCFQQHYVQTHLVLLI